LDANDINVLVELQQTAEYTTVKVLIGDKA